MSTLIHLISRPVALRRSSLLALLWLSACSTTPVTASAPCGPRDATGLQIGMCAPDFALPDRSGTPVSLYEQRGKVALVDISALW